MVASSLKAVLERYKAAVDQAVDPQSNAGVEGTILLSRAMQQHSSDTLCVQYCYHAGGEVPIGTVCKNKGCGTVSIGGGAWV